MLSTLPPTDERIKIPQPFYIEILAKKHSYSSKSFVVFKLVFVDWVHFSKVSNEMLLSISFIWSQNPAHFIYRNKNSIITNERTDLCFCGGKVWIPKWQGSTCQFIPQNHKHNLYFHLNRCLLVYGLLLIEAFVQPTHKHAKTLTPKSCAFF